MIKAKGKWWVVHTCIVCMGDLEIVYCFVCDLEERPFEIPLIS